MKRITDLIPPFAGLLFAAVLFADVPAMGAPLVDDGVERVSVPLDDPARPPQIRAHLLSGGITVRGGSTKEVIVEARGRAGESRESHESRPPSARGMKRLDLPGNAGLDIAESENVVNIKTAPWGRPADLVITVPRRSSLQLKCMNDGEILVEQVEGEIDADNLNGKVTLKNVSGSVVAHSLNGEVTVTLDQIDPSKPMSFSTLNGDIDVTLPDAVKANVRMKTDNGEIYSDFEVKLDSGGQVRRTESGRREDGSYHVRFDRALHGSINGGGPEFQFTTFNGQIYIRKKK
jgi:Putative adhesin